MQGNNFRAESKLLCFFIYFSVTTVISLTVVSLGLGKKSQDQQLFIRYFKCQSFGVDPVNTCVLEVDRRWDQALTLMFSTLIMFAPYVMMIYIIPVDKFKEKWQIWIQRNKCDSRR